MPCHTRMKTHILRGLVWFYLLRFGFMVTSLNPGYLDFDNLPDTNFSCVGKVIGGYYADLETSCQMFHVCTIGQLEEPMDIRFLCLNGTVFDQETRVCERIDEVDCSKSEQFYSLNLELYGNTQPPIVEESSETKQESVPKPHSTTTTTTTTTRRPSYKKTTQVPYYSTSTPVATVTHSTSKVISSHHFPVGTSSDIRFNPEEININLKSGSPPEIRTKPLQNFSESNRTTVYQSPQPPRYKSGNAQVQPTSNSHTRVISTVQLHPVLTTQTPKSVINYGLSHNKNTQRVTPSDINYGFTYSQPEKDYNTELPQRNFHYQSNFRPQGVSGPAYQQNSGVYRSSTYRTDYHSPSTKKINYRSQQSPTTFRSPTEYSSTRYNHRKTEKPQRIQIPLPLLPSLPPLTFSSPAPFSVTHHVDSKRYTNEQHQPPRIIISASASVSDNSGRRLNYSLGTIGTAHLFEQPPSSYDDYKEDDVGLDPFYHDVPKIKSTRQKRYAQKKHSDASNGDEETTDILKFLFDWYTNREKSTQLSIPVSPRDITEINDELSPINSNTFENDSSLFNNVTVEQRERIISNNQSVPHEDELNKFSLISENITDTVENTSVNVLSNTSEKEYYLQLNNTENTTSSTLNDYSFGKFNDNPYINNSDLFANGDSFKNAAAPGDYYDFVYDENTGSIQNDSNILETDKQTTADDNNKNSTLDNESALISSIDYVDDNYEPLVYKEPPKEYSESEHEKKLLKNNELFVKNETKDVTSEDIILSSVSKTSDKIEDNVSEDSIFSDGYNKGTLKTLDLVDNPRVDMATSLKENEKPDELLKTDSSILEDSTTTEKQIIKSSKRGKVRFNQINVVTETVFSTTEVVTETSITTENEMQSIYLGETTISNDNTDETDEITTVISSESTSPEKSFVETNSTFQDALETSSTSVPTTLIVNKETTATEIEFNSTTKNLQDSTNYDYTTTENVFTDTIIESSNMNALNEFIENIESSTRSKAVAYTTEGNAKNVTYIPQNTLMTLTTNPVTTETILRTSTERPVEKYNITEAQIENVLSSTTLATLTFDSTTSFSTTPISRRHRIRTKPTRGRNQDLSRRRAHFRHRFSNKLQDNELAEDYLINVKNNTVNKNTDAFEDKTTVIILSEKEEEKVSTTSAALVKSVNPTQAAQTTENITTPLSHHYHNQQQQHQHKFRIRKERVNKTYIFNCFGKEVNKFYSDPRDCRLFHYCTPGYSRNQVLDMKFVCDLGTYFDDNKLLCTKEKPLRCL